MKFTLFGLDVSIEKKTDKAWVSKLIKRALEAGKAASYDMKFKPNEISWKINRIKAIRLLAFPYPHDLVGETFNGEDWNVAKSSLASAKYFVDRYWSE